MKNSRPNFSKSTHFLQKRVKFVGIGLTQGTRSILPVKKGMRTCEITPSTVSFSLPTCEYVANKESRAQLLLVNVLPVLYMSGTLTQPLCQQRKSKKIAREVTGAADPLK